MTATPPVTVDAGRRSILSPGLLWTTIGANALVVLAAFEALAVATIMPTVAKDLHGQQFYSVAFAATLAASVIGMVVGGGWVDRTGPVKPLLASALVFVAGLLLSGTASEMSVFVAGRFLQGLGTGALNVVIYVIVARVYPSELHPRIFAAFSAAWVVPSMIGPAVAGFVLQVSSWHWVFVGVAALVVVATLTMIPALRSLRGSRPDRAGDVPPRIAPRLGLAVIVAISVVAIGVVGDLPSPWGWLAAATAVAVIVLAVRPLLPVGSLRLRRGLPATIVLRGAIAGSFFVTEVYLPYLLQRQYDLPPGVSGLALTAGAITWTIGSIVSSRDAATRPHATAVRIGSVLLVAGLAIELVTAAAHLSPLVAVAGCLAAGAGMGYMFTRISTLVLAYSTPLNQGENSAALSISDSVGGATAIALAGLIFLAAGGETSSWAFAAALAFTTAGAVGAVFVAFRVRER
jgi:MFS family permease